MVIIIILILLLVIGFVIYRRMSWRRMKPGHGTDPGRIMDFGKEPEVSRKDGSEKSGYLMASIPLVFENKEQSKPEETVVVFLKEDIGRSMYKRWICWNCDTINSNSDQSCCVCMNHK